MKLRHAIASLSAACVLSLAVGCATPSAPAVAVSPAQQSINALNTSYTALNAAILSAGSAVDAGVLKGQDARNARDAFAKTKEGLDAALAALKNAQAAAAASTPK